MVQPWRAPGPFADLKAEMRQCKDGRTCPALHSRAYYFEPNADTIDDWQAEGFYRNGLDRRVMFICESPGPVVLSRESSDTIRCWAVTGQDKRWRKARKEFGFEDCYLTNTVKCGVRRNGRHDDSELGACRPFLLCEIELVRPMVAVGVGGNAYEHLRRQVLPRLAYQPVIFQLTHYSARRDVWRRWEQEFPELQRLLQRLGQPQGWE